MNFRIEAKSGRFTTTEQAFLVKNHYSESYQSLKQRVYFCLYDGPMLIGMAVYGQAVSRHLNSDSVLELRRFCLIDETPRNTESWFLSRTLKHIRKTMPEVKNIITYADPNWGHDGTIYKATNFKFEGEEKSPNPRVVVLNESGKVHTIRELYAKSKGIYTESAMKLQKLVDVGDAKVYNVMKKLKYSYELK